jgi:hypothetical protein
VQKFVTFVHEYGFNAKTGLPPPLDFA